MHHKKVRNAISVDYGFRLHVSMVVETARLVVNNDTRRRHGRLRVPCADCGLRTQIRSNCWISGLIANGFFLFRGRDVAIAMNSVKILHAVRSAITAIAELLVTVSHICATSLHVNWQTTRAFSNLKLKNVLTFLLSKTA